MPVNIFISYRRDDAAGHAGRLCDRLEEHFPRSVFMDVSGIAPGTNFVRALERKLAACQVLIVVIGRSWLSITKARDGGEEPDHARIEVVTALRKGIPIIPVLVQGTRMPSRKELPEDIKPLADYNALEITEPDFRSDVRRLAEAIVQLHPPPPPSRGPKPDSNRIITPPPSTGVPTWVKVFVGLGTAVVVAVFGIFAIIAAAVSSAETQTAQPFDGGTGGQALISPTPGPRGGGGQKQKATPEPSPETEADDGVKAPPVQSVAGDFSPAGTWLVTVRTANGPLTGTYHLYPNNEMEFSGGAFHGTGTWGYDYAKSTLVISGTNNYGAGFQLVFGVGGRQGGDYQISSTYGPVTMRRVQ